MILRTCLLSFALSGLAFAQSSSVPAPDPVAEPIDVLMDDGSNDCDPGFSISLNNRDQLPCWTMFSPEDAVAQLDDQIRKAKAAVERMCELSVEEMTYDNTFAQLEALGSGIDGAQLMLVNLGSLMDGPELRKTREITDKMAADYGAWMSGNKELWQLIQTAAKQPWVKELSGPKQRLIQQVLDGYIDAGANLPAAQKAKLDQLSEELVQLRQRFSKNVLDGDNAAAFVVTDESQLAGLSDSWKALAAKAALEKGFGTPEAPQWLVTQDTSSYLTLLRTCDVEATRRRAWEASESTGTAPPYDNADVVYQILEKRQAIAELSGYKNFADMAAAHRMIKNGENIREFVDGMMAKLKPAWEKEIKDLLDFIAAKKGSAYPVMNPWDLPYYMEKLEQERYQFDADQLRPYLEFDRVIQVMFATLGDLYGFTVTELPTECPAADAPINPDKVNVWHPDVRFFQIKDKVSGLVIGQFYFDPFPRSTKNGGAWVMPLRSAAAGTEPQLGVLTTNVTPPIGDEPSLLDFDEVVTIFHEFGHMMHAMLTKAELESHAGTSVAWDFVEMPSQCNEHWAWEEAVLKQFAKHYQTGETIPDELLAKFMASRYFLPARDNMAQLCLAKIDLEMHSHYAELFKGKDIDDASHEVLKEWTVPMSVRRQSVMRYLTHCMSGGYAGAYYAYKWSEVLAADAFTRFKKEGIDNQETGASYRKAILEKGDSEPAEDIYREFMGREPNSDALLEEQGLL